jgi:hypothetical protein
MRNSLKVGLVPLLALALAGCSASTATNAPGHQVTSPSAPPSATGPNAVSDGGTNGASGGDPCRYLSVDEVRQALDFQDQMTTSHDTFGAGPTCHYTAPNAGFVSVTVVVASSRQYYDDEKSLTTASDCKSAGVGADSLYCPQSVQGWVVFAADGSSVSVTVMNVQSIAGPKGADSTQASLALAKLVAGRV